MYDSAVHEDFPIADFYRKWLIANYDDGKLADGIMDRFDRDYIKVVGKEEWDVDIFGEYGNLRTTIEVQQPSSSLCHCWRCGLFCLHWRP